MRARAAWGPLAVLACGLAFGLAAATATADDLPSEITADTIEYDRARELYVAEGHVRLVQEGRLLEADWVAFSRRTGQGVASGNVVVEDGSDRILAEFLEFQVEDLQGLLFDARFDGGPSDLRIEAGEIEKTGDQTYSLRDGRFTTCRCPDPDSTEPWRIRAARADIEVDGYGTARNTTFDVLGIPIIWLPWMVYPVKTERSTGLLFPELGIGGRNGFEVGLPLFWAARENVNVTLTPRYLEKRGIKPELDVEYVFGERSGGELFFSGIRDTDIVPNTPDTPYGSYRFAGTLEHDQDLPGGWRGIADVEWVSDNDYLLDFRRDIDDRSLDRFLESSVFAFRHAGRTGRLGLVAGARYADDLQNPDDRDRDRFLLQRLPELEAQWLPGRIPGIPGLVASLDAHYVYFTPLEEGARAEQTGATVVGEDLFLDTGIDALVDSKEPTAGAAADPHGDNAAVGGPEGDGLFQEGEPLADQGHRLVLHPRLSYPLRLGRLAGLTPEVGYQQVLYHTQAQGFEQRGRVTARADLSTHLRGQVDAPFLPPVTHVLEPRLSWNLVAKTSQSRNPLFVPPTAVPQDRVRQLDLDNLTLDTADRVERVNAVTLRLGNRFFSLGDETSGAKLRAELSLSAQYRLTEDAFGPIVLEGRTLRDSGISTRFQLAWDPEKSRIDEGLVGVRYQASWGGRLGARYRFFRTIPRFFEDFQLRPDRFEEFSSGFNRLSQIDFDVSLPLVWRWSAFYRLQYSLENDLVLTNSGGLQYLSRCACWAVRAELQDDRVRGVQANFGVILRGFGRGFGSGLSSSVFTQPRDR
ncbi:MAG: LPS assembly protein LptD [Proteobacteria bacterium]|nr:LPS assembly protein LptD [Pseudomonadota bacterium]